MKRGGFLGLLSAAAVPAPFGPTGFATALRIAVVAPFSGAQRSAGEQLATGMRAAADELNDLRLPSERALVIDTYDDRNDPSQAGIQASFATGNGDTLAVVGHLSAAPTLAALDVYANAAIPLIVPTVTDDRVTAKGYRNVFRLPAKDATEGALLAAAALAAGAAAPVVATLDGSYGPQVAAGFVRGASARRIDAPALTIARDGLDPRGAAARILAAKPDSVTLAGTAGEMGEILVALRAQGYGGALFASQGFFDPLTVGRYAKAAEGMRISTDVPYFPLAPTAARDVQAYQLRYGSLGPVAAYGYAAVQIVQQAARRATGITRINLIRTIATGGQFDTVAGIFTFGVTGDPLDANCYFYAVRDGTFAYDRQAHPSGFMLH